MNDQDPLYGLDEESRDAIQNMFSGCEEVVGVEHVSSVLSGAPSHSGDAQLVAYIGLEPSGKAHLGWVILSDTIRKLLDSNVNVIVLLADWHAWVNDKFGRDMEKISLAADYMTEVFRALLGNPPEGEGPGQIRFIRASEVMDSGKYWERVLRCSKNMSLSRVRRTFSIMGRTEDSSDHDLSAFYYPALQAADIFELKIDIAFGGMDQRKAHMYIHDLLKKKMKKAFLEVGNPSSAIFEIVEHVILPRLGSVKVIPDPKYGVPSEYADLESFSSAVSEGAIHPLDAKMAVADGLAEVLSPISEHFSSRTELMSAMNSITGSQ